MAEEQPPKVLELGGSFGAEGQLSRPVPGVLDDRDRLLQRPWHQTGDLFLLDLLGPNARSYDERSKTALGGQDLRFKLAGARIELDQPGTLSFYQLFVGVINFLGEQ